jgi:hypothetical protein
VRCGCLSLKHWNHEFEFHSRHGFVSAFFYVVLSCVGGDCHRPMSPSKESYKVSTNVLQTVRKSSNSYSELLHLSYISSE